MASVLPAVGFTTPPSDPPERAVSTCSPPQARYDDAPAKEYSNAPAEETFNVPAKEKFIVPAEVQSNINEGHNGDEESQSLGPSNNDEISYPEGGLSAWLVVLGSCFGTAVTLGLM